MQSFRIRVNPRNKTLYWSAVIGYITFIIVVSVILAMNVLDLPRGRNRLELALIVVPLTLPLFAIMWLMGRRCDLQVGNGVLIAHTGPQETARIGFHEIGHARVTGQQHRLEVYDHARQLRLVVDPMFASNTPGRVLDMLCATLPHRAQERIGRQLQVSFTERFVDFAPPPGMPPQPHPPVPPQPLEPPRKLWDHEPGI